jgi:hypothetical protein
MFGEAVSLSISALTSPPIFWQSLWGIAGSAAEAAFNEIKLNSKPDAIVLGNRMMFSLFQTSSKI